MTAFSKFLLYMPIILMEAILLARFKCPIFQTKGV